MTTLTLQQYMSKHHNYTFDGEIGIEIETETRGAYETPTFTYWTPHSDGSLRNFGVEYVLSQPLNYGSQHYKDAMKEFSEKTKLLKFLPSVYTSVHVHFNQKNRTLVELFNFITLYFLFEETLTRYCGTDRDGNLFCLKTSNAEQNHRHVLLLAEALEKGNRRHIGSLNTNMLKYAGLNIAPLRNFGSLEIRTHGGTTDITLVDRWVSMLNNAIYCGAKKYSNPIEIIDTLQKLGTKKFFENHFLGYMGHIDHSHLEEDFEKTLWFAASLASSVENWDSLGVVKEKVNPYKSLNVGINNVDFAFNDEEVNERTGEIRNLFRRSYGETAPTHILQEDF